MEIVEQAYAGSLNGKWSKWPMVEMTIPTSVDPSIAPKGGHVALLFTQYTPYHLDGGLKWDENTKKEYANLVFSNIEQYCPGFERSVVGYEVLSPPDLESIFGLTGGNIFHGAITLDQLYFARPFPHYANYRTPISGLFLCGSGAHPGGGVTGGPGRLAALTAINDLKAAKK